MKTLKAEDLSGKSLVRFPPQMKSKRAAEKPRSNSSSFPLKVPPTLPPSSPAARTRHTFILVSINDEAKILMLL